MFNDNFSVNSGYVSIRYQANGFLAESSNDDRVKSLSTVETADQASVKTSIYGDQDRYNSFVEKSVQAVCTSLQTFPKDRARLVALFPEFLFRLGTIRYHIASEMKSEDLDLFGTLRTDPAFKDQHCQITPGKDQYEGMAETIKKMMLNYVESMVSNSDKLGRAKSVGAWTYTVRPIFKSKSDSYKALADVAREKLRRGEELTNEEIDGATCWHSFVDLARGSPRGASMNVFMMGTIEKVVNGQKMILTRHVVGFQVATEGKICSNDVTRFTQQGEVVIIHTPIANQKELIADMATVFADAVLWDGQDSSKLATTLAKLSFRISQIMPYFRGSASCMEFLYMGILKYFNRTVLVKPDCIIDQEALACPFENVFVRNYKRLFE